MDPRVIVGVALDTIAGGIPDDIRADYLACYDGDRFAESMHCVRRYRGTARACRAAAAGHGAGHDYQRPPRPRRPLANAEFLDLRLPTSRLVIIDAGHFVWEEAPAKYASTVLDSMTGNWP